MDYGLRPVDYASGARCGLRFAVLAVDYVADATVDYAPDGAVDSPALKGRQFTAGGERSVTPGKRIIIKIPLPWEGAGGGHCNLTHYLSLPLTRGEPSSRGTRYACLH